MNKNIKLLKKNDDYDPTIISEELIDTKEAAKILREFQYSHAVVFEGRIPNGLHIDSRVITSQKKVWYNSMGYKTSYIRSNVLLKDTVGHYDLILAMLEHCLEFSGPTAWPWPRKVLEIHIWGDGEDPVYNEDYFKDYK